MRLSFTKNKSPMLIGVVRERTVDVYKRQLLDHTL